MPRRGYVLQPRVAASATLGGSRKDSTATRLRNLSKMPAHRRNRVAVEKQIGRIPRVAQSGNPGLKDGAPSGHNTRSPALRF